MEEGKQKTSMFKIIGIVVVIRNIMYCNSFSKKNRRARGYQYTGTAN